MTPLELIENLSMTDRYIKTIFTQGGCYQFHLFLKSIWPDAIPVINQTADHVGTLIDGDVYDINGVADWSWRAMDDEDIEVASKWSFGANSLISIGECEFCEEPILI